MAEARLFKFPCDFPLKGMGRRSDDFRSIVLGIVQKHAGAIDAGRIEERPSRDGNYLSLTCTFGAQTGARLDALSQERASCERVLVVLYPSPAATRITTLPCERRPLSTSSA